MINMKYINTSQGQQVIVDNEDFEQLSIYKWRFNARYVMNSKQKTIQSLIINAPNGYEIDHINGNTLDNRKINLRLCDRSENLANRKMFKNNKSGYKGVCWHKQYKKWHAQIQFRKQHINIGFFDNLLEAAKAYDQKAKKFHGNFAKLNFEEMN